MIHSLYSKISPDPSFFKEGNKKTMDLSNGGIGKFSLSSFVCVTSPFEKGGLRGD
jgi:hypothetical protein